ncbi:flagellar hook-length control protein FliK [Desulfotomaculum sp. 1211_IL3151]|uniref:flagellar hook-length control protein FliK n=1 Tax=Desulfotomaculum sp. 1211_IL3151 TaxID=3084055 RepID=UPI002FD98359
MLLDCLLGSNCNQDTASDGLIKDFSHDPGLVEGFLYPGMLTDFEGDQEQAQAETDMNLNKEDADAVRQTLPLEDGAGLILPLYVANDTPVRTNEVPSGIGQPEGTDNPSGGVKGVTLNVPEEVGLVAKDAGLSELSLADNGLEHVDSVVEGKRQIQVGPMVNERIAQAANSPKLQAGNSPVMQKQDFSGFENGINTIIKEVDSSPFDKNPENIQIVELMPKFIKKEDGIRKVSSDQPIEDVIETQSTIESSLDTELQPAKQLVKEKAAIPLAFEKSVPDKGIGNQVNQGSTDRVVPRLREETKPLPDNLNRDSLGPSSHNLAQNANGKGMEASSSLPKDVPLTQLPAKLHEMVKGLLVQQHAGHTALKMRLQPEHLGEVTVKLIWSKGELSAQFLTSSGLAKEALETAFPQLRELLAQQNIRLSEAAVFMGQQTNDQGDQNSFAERQRWQENGPKKAKGYPTETNSVEESLPVGGAISPNSGLNLVV